MITIGGSIPLLASCFARSHQRFYLLSISVLLAKPLTNSIIGSVTDFDSVCGSSSLPWSSGHFVANRPISGTFVDDEVILEIKPMKIDLSDHVQALAKKATHPNSETPDSALKYSQAALNLAHAMATINSIKEA